MDYELFECKGRSCQVPMIHKIIEWIPVKYGNPHTQIMFDIFLKKWFVEQKCHIYIRLQLISKRAHAYLLYRTGKNHVLRRLQQKWVL